MFRYILINKRKGRLVLQHDPIGWNTNSHKFKRSEQYHGITVEYSTELEFIKDGRDYIQDVYETEGIEGEINIYVQRMNLNLLWDTDFVGVINLDKYDISDTGIKTNIEQTGFAMRFINGEDLEINLNKLTSPLGEPITPFTNETQSITLHSKVIRRGYEARISDDAPTDYESDVVDNSNARDATIVIGWDNIIRNELKAFTYATGFSFDGNVFEILERSAEQGPMSIHIRFKALVEIDWIQGQFDRGTIEFFYRRNEGAPVKLAGFSDKKDGKEDYIRTVDFDFQTEEDIQIGDKIYFWGRVFGDDVSGAYRWRFRIRPDKVVSFIKIDSLTQTPETPSRGMLAHEVGARLTEAITGQPDSFVSDFLGRTDSQPRQYPADGRGSLLFFTNGAQIRNFPWGERPPVTTYKKWYAGMDATYCLGTGIEIVEGKERIRVEPRSYFYRPEVVLTLGKVTNLHKVSASAYAYNQAEFGYTKWQTESDNGLDEFNSRRAYALPLTKVKKKYSAISEFIAGGYSIETTRRQQYNLGTDKDTSKDDDLYVICVLRDGTSFVTERNTAFAEIANVISPETVYNARISPSRMALNHAGNLKAGLLHQLDKYIKFTTGEGNYRMASRLLNETKIITENQDFLIAELPDPIGYPEIYTFSYGLQPHEIQQIKNNPYGLVQFEDSLGNIKQGYLLELDASSMESSNFELLRRFE